MLYDKEIAMIDIAIKRMKKEKQRLLALQDGKPALCKFRGKLIKKASPCSVIEGWVECNNPKNPASKVTTCTCNGKCKFYTIG